MIIYQVSNKIHFHSFEKGIVLKKYKVVLTTSLILSNGFFLTLSKKCILFTKEDRYYFIQIDITF